MLRMGKGNVMFKRTKNDAELKSFSIGTKDGLPDEADTLFTTSDTSESDHTIKGFKINLQDTDEAKLDNSDEEYIEPCKIKAVCSDSELNLPDIDDAERSDDGVTIMPCKIGVYGNIMVNKAEAFWAKDAGRPSLVRTVNGVAHCIVVKTENAFGVIKKGKSEDSATIDWTMNRLDINKKVKTADGRIYIDSVVRDDLSEKSVRIPLSDFTEGRINSLIKFGLSLNSKYAFTMSVYFQRLIENMPTEDASQKIGVIKNTHTQEYEFNAYNIPDGFIMRTEYEDLQEYYEGLNVLIKSSPAIQYLISVSMSAPVLTLLQKQYKLDLHSYVVNIICASSTGKTTTQRLCASMWTKPDSDKIFSAMLSTSNAALKRLDGRFGIPTFIDEATVTGNISPTEYAYSVYEEREKRRLNSDCSEKVSGTWSTIPIMSSEQHFHSNSKVQNGGMAVRVHSMENLVFTQNKDHADKINNFIRYNYGVVGYDFTNMLFEGDFGNLENRYNEAKESMMPFVEDCISDLTPRLVNIYAVTFMTAEFLEEMGLAIDPETVAEIMADHNKMVANEQNLALNAHRAIISYIVRNPMKSGIRKFETDDGTLIKVAIEESLTQEILARAGFTDLKVTIKEMDKAGYLIRQQDGRLKSKLTIDGNLGNVYQFDMSGFSEGVVTEKQMIKSLIKEEPDEYVY